MKLLKIITFLLLGLFISGCTPKLTVKSLHPSQIPNEKFYTINIEDFENDNINQSFKIEEKISNKVIDRKRVFKVTNKKYADVIVTGEVLESSLFYDIYYKRYINYNRCRYYRYDEKSKKKTCIEYYKRVIPCENREYKVKTKIRVLNPSEKTVLFSKTYNKSKNTQECYEDYYYPYHSFSRNKRETNSVLASNIASEFIDDISPHYVYFDLEIINELDDSKIKYTKEEKEIFVKLSELIEDKKIHTAKEQLLKLNEYLKGKSWEVLYNLALTYESQRKLYEANNYYKKAKLQVLNIEHLVLVNNAINRTQKNLEEKIKAKSQLP